MNNEDWETLFGCFAPEQQRVQLRSVVGLASATQPYPLTSEFNDLLRAAGVDPELRGEEFTAALDRADMEELFVACMEFVKRHPPSITRADGTKVDWLVRLKSVSVQVKDTTFDGDEATCAVVANVPDQEARQAALGFVRIDGNWRIATPMSR